MSAKKVLFLIFVCLSTLLLAIFSFQTIEITEAQVSGKEIEEYVLTGYQGYYPYHYFDELTNASHTKDEIEYINANGQKTSEFRAIEENFSNIFGSEFAKGMVNISLSGEMNSLANTGHYYAYASAGLLALNDKASSRVIISLSGNNGASSRTSTKVQTSGIYSPEWVSTDRIYLKNSEDSLKFQFSTLDKATVFTGSKFLIFEPYVCFGVEIDKITNSTIGSVVSDGQVVQLKASTFLSNLEGSSLIQHYQNLHKIEWEIVSGAENGNILGNYLNITGNSGSISVRPKCLKYSDSTEYVYGETVTFQIDSTKLSVSAISNFEEGASIVGTGNSFSANRYVNIFVTVNEGYSLLNIQDENGDTYQPTLKPSGAYQVRLRLENQSKVLNVNLVKDLEIECVKIKDKAYDKTNIAEIEEIIFKNASLSHGVSVDLSDFTALYNSIYPQNDIKINFQGQIKLSGENAKFYNITGKIPSTTGNILKRNILVKADNIQIEYGDPSPVLTYTIEGDMLEGDSLNGSLYAGNVQEIGQYQIGIGTLNNSYYEIDFKPATLTITKRFIKISNVFVEDKVYDRTSNILNNSINFDQIGSFLPYLDAKLKISASFADANASKNKIVNFSVEIVGEDKNLYELVYDNKPVYANILPKQIVVSAVSAEKTYGEQDPVLTYNFNENDLFEGDSLTGQIQRTSGEDVGNYQIGKGTLALANYEIIFQTAVFKINAKQISIKADNKEKIYGEYDPKLTYRITSGELLGSDALGLTLKRTSGEVVGTYNILINSQLNHNYQINFTQGQFTIKKRDVEINIAPISKQYDGTTNCKLNIQIQNEIVSDNLKVNLKANFNSANVGLKQVSYSNLNNQEISVFDSKILSGSNLTCYKFTFNVLTAGQIEKRNISITLPEEYTFKEYGEQDKEFCYEVVNGIGENLVGELSRAEGEEVGIYLISCGSLNEENNPNYAISYDFDDKFTIIKKKLTVVVPNKEIEFGEEEQEIQFYLINSGFEIADYVSGSPTRESGTNVGEYNYLAGTLQIKEDKSNHYELNFVLGKLTIISKGINIIINNQTKVYGSQDPEFTFTANQNIENLNIVCTREEGEDVGSYIITAQIVDDNYTFTFTPGILSITPSKLTITASSIVKTYGEQDPDLTYYISSGIFKFEDTLSSVISGSLIRETGEDAGEYNINIGSLRANQNYQIKFVGAKFTILKRDLIVTANDITTFYNEDVDPELTYLLTGNVDDDFELSLEREEGNEPGEYRIILKDYFAPNYNIIFTEGKFTIKKRSIKIEVNYSSKIYDGTDSAELSYQISGDLKEGENLDVVLSKAPGTNVGRYLVQAECDNKLYDIEIVNNYFDIFKRDVQIVADSFEITYGDEIPTLTYTIFGNIENSELVVNLYRTENISVGTYTIYASILNADNYNVSYTNGYLTINKANLEINILSAEKIYGSQDPVFEYVIVSGRLLNNDMLNGNIIRQQGESIGEYNLCSNLQNDNYEITTSCGKLTILQKEIYLVTSAANKVYDGTDVAAIRTPTLSGVLENDEVYFDYEINSVAKFQSIEVGNNIPIIVYGGQLAGKDAQNYIVIRPTNLTANITNAEIVDDNIDNISIQAKNTNTNLSLGTTLVSEDYTAKIDKNEFESSKNVLNAYNLNLTLDGQQVQDCGKINVSIKLDKTGYNNVQVYRINSDNSKTLLNATIKEDKVTFETEELGVFVVVADNDGWLNIVLIITICLTVTIGLLIAYRAYTNKKRKKSR